MTAVAFLALAIAALAVLLLVVQAGRHHQHQALLLDRFERERRELLNRIQRPEAWIPLEDPAPHRELTDEEIARMTALSRVGEVRDA